MFAGYAFAQSPFAGLMTRLRRRPSGAGGIGGSGMSDEEYRRLLRRLGAIVSDDMTRSDLELAAFALRELGML